MGFMRNRSGWLRWQNAEELLSEFYCVTWVNVDAQTRFQKLTTMADKKRPLYSGGGMTVRRKLNLQGPAAVTVTDAGATRPLLA